MSKRPRSSEYRSEDTDKESSDESEELNEDDILRDIENQEIYIRRIKKSEVKNTNQKKTHDRVYNAYHSCYFCKRLVQHIPTHMEIHRKDEPEVKKMFDEFRKPNFDRLRKLGDDAHNQEVIRKNKGELLLCRRPTDILCANDFGPCPLCRDWVRLDNIKKHNEKCKDSDKRRMTKRELLLHSDIISGRITGKASTLLQKEVISTMRNDDITKVAQADPVIVSLGESWLRRSIDNIGKRKYYASQHMRLCARLLIELRNMKTKEADEEDQGSEDEETQDCSENEMSDFLVPTRFDMVAEAALRACYPFMDDLTELKSPSNAIKLKYDIKRMVNAKWAAILKSNGMKEEAKTCKEFLCLMSMEWNEKVARTARAMLTQRQFDKTPTLPAPDDIAKLSSYLIKNLKEFDYSQTNAASYQKVVKLAQARLTVYNKRRSGEMDVIR